MAQASSGKSHQDLLRMARKRFQRALDKERENRDAALEDLRFLHGDQWPESIRRERESEQRPCLTFNRLTQFVDQVVGEQRQNRPGIKVRPVDHLSDPRLAEILGGVIRNIEYVSGADTAYDTAFEQAVSCGFGYFRILTAYSDDDSFEQDIRIRRITNPFSVYFDPDATEPDRTDARFCFITEYMDGDDFTAAYPGKESLVAQGTGMGDDLAHWGDRDGVRVAEYWYKEPVAKRLVLLSTGETVDGEDFDAAEFALAEQGVTRLAERTVNTHKVMWAKMTGQEVLEGPMEWPGKYIPVVPVLGKELTLQGKTLYRGLIRFAKDAQRMYNYFRTVSAEGVALAPKAPWLATPEQLEGHEPQWNQAHKKSYPYLLYNHDPSVPLPQRQPPPQMSPGFAQEAAQAVDDMKAATGIYDAGLGARSNEVSGVAIFARQREGDVSTFAFMDNLSRAIRHAGRILVDLIPRIYDTERIIRLRGLDDAERFVTVNRVVLDPITGREVVLNDLSMGKYDVVVSVGPSYSTQRMEAADAMLRFIQAYPQSAPLLGDILARNLDWPGADEIAQRLRKTLPPEILAPDDAPPPQPAPAPDPIMALELANQQATLEGKQLLNQERTLRLKQKAEQELEKQVEQVEKERVKGVVLETLAGLAGPDGR